MMSKDNKELKAKREIIAKTIETDYKARKARIHDETFPKYLYATRLNLEKPTYKNLVLFRDILTPKEMDEKFTKEQIHSENRLRIMEIMKMQAA